MSFKLSLQNCRHTTHLVCELWYLRFDQWWSLETGPYPTCVCIMVTEFWSVLKFRNWTISNLGVCVSWYRRFDQCWSLETGPYPICVCVYYGTWGLINVQVQKPDLIQLVCVCIMVPEVWSVFKFSNQTIWSFELQMLLKRINFKTYSR